MVELFQDRFPVEYPLPCAVCRACHKLLTELDECPEPEDWRDVNVCESECPSYDEIYDETELKEELDKDKDRHLLDEPEED